MKKRLAVLIGLCFSAIVNADVGYEFKGDINGDGIPDSIESGPIAYFGSGGGPFLVTLSGKDGSPVASIIMAHPMSLYLEVHARGNSLWTYQHLSSDDGILRLVSLDGFFKVSSLPIKVQKVGDGDSELGKSFLSAIESELIKIEFKSRQDYVPPNALWGK